MATRPKTTVIADDTTQDAPQTTSPGDAPADTFDPTERVSSARPDKAAAAAAGHLTVNAVEPVDPIEAPVVEGGVRVETRTVYDAAGNPVASTRDLDTGETITAADWEATTEYAEGDFVDLSTGERMEATTAGTSGSTEPTAPTEVDGTVTDGTVVWTRRF